MVNKFDYQIGFKRNKGFFVIECYYDDEHKPIGWITASLEDYDNPDDLMGSIQKILNNINPKNIYDLDDFPNYYLEGLHEKDSN